MAKFTQEQAERFIGKPMADFTEDDIARVNKAESDPIGSAAEISETALPDPAEMHSRIQLLEALVEYIFQTHFRTVKVDDVVEQWLKNRAGSKVLDETVRGRA